VRLAHALDAAPVLAAVRRHLVQEEVPYDIAPIIAEAAKLAALCGWEDVPRRDRGGFCLLAAGAAQRRGNAGAAGILDQPTIHRSRLVPNSLKGALPARARELGGGAAAGEPRR
jgi:hypothetical protein